MVSAVLCTSALLSDAQLSRIDVQEQPPAAAPDSTEPGLRGSNSLARYLVQQGSQQQPKPLKAQAAEYFFAVTNLDFDRETGLIRAVSSQSEDCSLLVSFADQDHPANIYKTEIPVPAGEYTASSGTADPALLPAYFTVQAQLVNRIGLPVGQPFVLNRYTREMQEILGKNVSDFEPEQVVNFDDDETTNFLVLSDDTVRAETTAVSNTLVSADYDQNIYVFDNIDESIRSLEQGQYFYIQPTDTDIISTDVQEIVIEGDTATITGSGEIGDMFDFVKIEAEETKTVEISADKCSYLGVNAQTITDEDTLNRREADFLVLDDAEIHDITKKDTLKTDLKSESGRFQLTPFPTVQVSIKYNFYRKFGFINELLVCEASFAFDASAKLSSAKDERFAPLETIGKTKEEADKIRSKSHTFQVPVKTVGCATISLFADLALSLDGELEFGIEKKFTKGFAYDSDHGLEEIDFDTEPVTTKLNLSGSATVELKVGIEVSALKGLVKGSVAGGVSVTVTGSKDGLLYSNPLPGANVFIADADTDGESIHACEKCLKLTATTKVSIEVKLGVGFDVKDKSKILKKLDDVFQVGKLKLEASFSKETDTIGNFKIPAIDIYALYNSDGDRKGLHFNFIPRKDDKETECPMRAYKTTFNVSFAGAPAGTEAVLRIDDTEVPLPIQEYGKTVLYCVPRNGKYGYTILINGERVADGNFIGPNSATILYHTFTWQKRDDGSDEIVCESGLPSVIPLQKSRISVF